MSCVLPASAASDVCANCGRTGDGDDAVKLKNCTACLLVKYCGVDCQKAHREEHKKACKKRAAELKDERLYEQGRERLEGDACPICTLPVPFPLCQHSTFRPCCFKKVCDGCILAAQQRGFGDDCPFCRARTPCTDDNASQIAMIRKRVEANDANAVFFLGLQYFHGRLGMDKDVQSAVELWTEAAELGSRDAHFKLGRVYMIGDGVERDEKRGLGHWEFAAMKGDVDSRHNLGVFQLNKGNYNLATKHFMISAKLGFKTSLDELKKMFTRGDATKEQYVEALKGYGDAVEETKSHQREEARGVPTYSLF